MMSKKRSRTIESDQCSITEIRLKNNKLEPIIVNFEHADLKEEGVLQLKAGVYVNKRNKNERAVAVATDQKVYAGYSSSSFMRNTADICQTFLALRNKKTNKVRLIEASQFLLSPSLHSSSPTLTKKTASNVTSDLVNTFGSKKLRRSYNQSQKLKVNVEATKEKLEEVAANVEVKKEDLTVSTQSSVQRVTPPCNRDASTVEGVYQLSTFLSDWDLEELTNEAHRILALKKNDLKELEQSKSNSPYFISTLRNLQIVKNPSQKLLLAKILVYTELLINLFMMSYKHFQKRPLIVCSFSKSINEKLLSSFTEEGCKGRNRSPLMKDKTCCYAIVLALLTCQYTITFKDIAPTFGLAAKKLTNLCQSVGATVHNPNNPEGYAVLKLPLENLTKKTVSYRNSQKKIGK